MGTPGVKWECRKDTLVNALKNARGRITYVAKALNVTHNTIWKKIREYELENYMNELRNEFDDNLLDSAESTLISAMSRIDQDLGCALKASFYILNNKGKSRSYSQYKSTMGQMYDSREELSKELKELENYLKQISHPGSNADTKKSSKSEVAPDTSL